jgi:hypothetical protein
MSITTPARAKEVVLATLFSTLRRAHHMFFEITSYISQEYSSAT